MRTKRSIGAALVATILPVGATLAATPAPPVTRTWGNVPNVALQPPVRSAPAPQGSGWGPGGYRGGNAGVPGAGAPLPPGHPPVADAPLPPGHPALGMRTPRSGGPGYGTPPHPGLPADPGDRFRGRGGVSGFGGGHARGYGNGGYALRRGTRLPGYFLTPGYAIGNWGAYGLAAPGFGNSWIRYYDGAALIDGSGIVRDYRETVDWGPGYGGGDFGVGYTEGWQDGFDDGVDYAEDAVSYRGKWQRGRGGNFAARPPAYGYGVPGGYAYGAPAYGYGAPGYGYGSGYATSYGAGGAQVYSAGGASVVVVQGAPAVTTTTTTVEETSYVAIAAKRAWKRPVRAWKPRARPRCVCVVR